MQVDFRVRLVSSIATRAKQNALVTDQLNEDFNEERREASADGKRRYRLKKAAKGSYDIARDEKHAEMVQHSLVSMKKEERKFISWLKKRKILQFLLTTDDR